MLSSNVPIGSGLSSSAALEVAFGYTWQQVSGFSLSRRELALAAQQAENEYVGVRCGILDQITSSLGRRGHALLFDCRTLDAELVSLSDNLAIVVADSGVRRALAGSEYNLRRSQCEQAVDILSQHYPGIRALRDVTKAQLEQHREDLPELIYRRARHIVTDNARVLQAKTALQEGNIAQVGALMTACHISLRDDYEVSAPELDKLVEAACEVDGCYGARLTGAGFGGCAIALAVPEAVGDLKQHITSVYESTFSRVPTVYVCHSANGVERIQ
jgi:galactokinase